VRRLTNQQVAVLAAVERLGHPLLVDLRRDLSALGMSTIYRHIEALQRRGLVVEQGDPPRYAAVAQDRDADMLGSLPAWE
jgi:Fe2+ or Zn2+ uptake regulation protein